MVHASFGHRQALGCPYQTAPLVASAVGPEHIRRSRVFLRNCSTCPVIQGLARARAVLPLTGFYTYQLMQLSITRYGAPFPIDARLVVMPPLEA